MTEGFLEPRIIRRFEDLLTLQTSQATVRYVSENAKASEAGLAVLEKAVKSMGDRRFADLSAGLRSECERLWFEALRILHGESMWVEVREGMYATEHLRVYSGVFQRGDGALRRLD